MFDYSDHNLLTVSRDDSELAFSYSNSNFYLLYNENNKVDIDYEIGYRLLEEIDNLFYYLDEHYLEENDKDFFDSIPDDEPTAKICYYFKFGNKRVNSEFTLRKKDFNELINRTGKYDLLDELYKLLEEFDFKPSNSHYFKRFLIKQQEN